MAGSQSRTDAELSDTMAPETARGARIFTAAGPTMIGEHVPEHEGDDKIIALIVQADGTARTDWVARSSVDEYQRIVGGPVEMISGDTWGAYLNEEGKIAGLPANARADSIARLHGWRGSADDVLVGTVIFLGLTDDEGYDTSCDIDLIREVMGGNITID